MHQNPKLFPVVSGFGRSFRCLFHRISLGIQRQVGVLHGLLLCNVWLAGSLLGLTLCKLLLFDLADHQTVYRIISFLFLGLLMLGMGYFCPLPPKRREEASEQNSSPAP